MTNEFLNYPMYGCIGDAVIVEQMDFTTFINKYNDEERLHLQRRDSILVAHPLLSKRYKDYTDGIRTSFFANNLGQMRFNRRQVKREEIFGEACRRNLFNIDVPYLVLQRYDYFLDHFCSAAIEKYCLINNGVTFLQGIRRGHLQQDCGALPRPLHLHRRVGDMVRPLQADDGLRAADEGKVERPRPRLSIPLQQQQR